MTEAADHEPDLAAVRKKVYVGRRFWFAPCLCGRSRCRWFTETDPPPQERKGWARFEGPPEQAPPH